jgi:hypothetical protein
LKMNMFPSHDPGERKRIFITTKGFKKQKICDQRRKSVKEKS